MRFILKVYTDLSRTSISFFIHTVLTRRILITIYNILKYLSCIKIAYVNNNNNNNNNNKNNNKLVSLFALRISLLVFI